MNRATAWRLARAETRRSWGRLSICVACIALGVFALTLVRAVTASINGSLAGQAQTTMGADLMISARRPLKDTRAQALTRELQQRGARSANQTRFYSMLSRGDQSRAEPGGEQGSPKQSSNEPSTQLVRVRAVGSDFPFYGKIDTVPARQFERLEDAPQVVIDGQIARRLQLKPGDVVKIGELSATVLAEFISRPGSPTAGFSLAPSVYLHERFLPQTKLLQTGSRVSYERFFAVPKDFDVDAWKQEAELEELESDQLSDGVSISTAEDETSNMQRFLDRLSGFLTVVAQVTLLLGAVGIGSSMRTFMLAKLDHAAIFRVIGVTPRGLFAIYGMMALWIASIGCVLGATCGVLFPLALSRVLAALGQGFLPEGLTLSLEPMAALYGALAGLLATIAFTLLPILQTALVSPLRILRRDVESQGGKRSRRKIIGLSLGCSLLVGALMVSVSSAGIDKIGTAFLAAVLLCVAVLWVLATLLLRASRWLSSRAQSYAIRQGVANLHRPGNQTTSVIVSVGLGVLLLSTMFILQSSLQQAISIDQQRGLPNLFVIDIQTDQLSEVMGKIRAAGADEIEESPMIAARIAAINGTPLSEEARGTDGGGENEESAENGAGERSSEARDRDRVRTREYFISYRDALIESESLSQGQFWSAQTKRQEASLDAQFAGSLGIELGDVLTLNIQGLPLDALVTSFREIHWQAVRPNSLILLSPGEIEDAPRQHVVSFRVGDYRRYEMQSSLIGQFPNLTVIDITEATKTVKLIISRISAVFRGLGSLTILAGILVLGGAVTSGRNARQREAMLLKVVGAKRAILRNILLTEQIALSSLGAVLGWLLAEVLARVLWPIFFSVPVHVPYEFILLLVLGTVLLSAALGTVLSRRVSQSPALEILRQE